MDADLKDAYDEVLRASQPQPADNELAILKKHLAQERIVSAGQNEYIKGLKQLVKELKSRVAALEEIVQSESKGL
jgi:hypothetical protein